MKFSPEIYTENIDACVAFYGELGFAVKQQLEGFVVLSHKQNPAYELLLCEPKSPFVNPIFHPAFKGQGLIFQLEVSDVDGEYERLSHIPKVLDIVTEDKGNGRHFTIADPNGILIDIVQFD